MDAVTWAKAKGPAYVVLSVGAMICVAILIGYTGMRINNPSYQPVVDPWFIITACMILSFAAMKLDKSDNGSTLSYRC